MKIWNLKGEFLNLNITQRKSNKKREKSTSIIANKLKIRKFFNSYDIKYTKNLENTTKKKVKGCCFHKFFNKT